MISFAYANKAPTGDTGPDDYPVGWTYPGPPWPPGWPATGTGSVEVTLPTKMKYNESLSFESRCLDSENADDSTYNNWSMRVSATIEGETVQVKENLTDSYEDYVDIVISNYSGSKYGINPTGLYFDLSASNVGDTMTVTCTVQGVNTITGSDTIRIVNTDNYDPANNFDISEAFGWGFGFSGPPFPAGGQVIVSADETSYSSQTPDGDGYLGAATAVEGEGIDIVTTPPDAIHTYDTVVGGTLEVWSTYEFPVEVGVVIGGEVSLGTATDSGSDDGIYNILTLNFNAAGITIPEGVTEMFLFIVPSDDYEFFDVNTSIIVKNFVLTISK